MLLSKEVLERVDFYECNRFAEGGKQSTVTLYWKIQWWQFWLPHKQVIRMSTVANGNDTTTRVADGEWRELVGQLKEWFRAKAREIRESEKLYSIDDGKKEDE